MDNKKFFRDIRLKLDLWAEIDIAIDEFDRANELMQCGEFYQQYEENCRWRNEIVLSALEQSRSFLEDQIRFDMEEFLKVR